MNAPHLGLWAFPGLCIAAIGASYGVSVAVVSLDRRGGWTRLVERLSMLSLRRRRSVPFRSALHAQIWFEFRRWGWALPLFAAVVGSIPIFTAMHGLWTDSSFLYTWVPSLVAVPGAGLCAGLLLLALTHNDTSSGQADFFHVRPVATRVLASARLRAGFKSLVVSVTGLTVLHVIYCGILALMPSAPEGLASRELSSAGYELALRAALLWTILWLPIPALLCCLVLALSLISSGLSLDGWHEANLVWAFLAIAIALGGVDAFYLAAKRKLLGGRSAALAAAGLVISSVLFAYFGFYGERMLLSYSLGTGMLLLVFWIVPAVPIASVPLGIHRRRHQ